eukprot:860039-Amphidinium_carterae.2
MHSPRQCALIGAPTNMLSEGHAHEEILKYESASKGTMACSCSAHLVSHTWTTVTQNSTFQRHPCEEQLFFKKIREMVASCLGTLGVGRARVCGNFKSLAEAETSANEIIVKMSCCSTQNAQGNVRLDQQLCESRMSSLHKGAIQVTAAANQSIECFNLS